METLEQHLLAQTEKSRQFFWHRIRWHLVCSRLNVAQPVHLLDIGAGVGLFGDHLRQKFPQVTYNFIETIPSLKQRLRETYGEVADQEGATQFDGISYVTLMDVLEHQKDDREFLKNLVLKMEKGSLLLITVPAFQLFWSSWDESLGHYRRYTKSRLKSILTGLPAKSLEMSYVFPELVPSALFRRLRRAILRVDPLGKEAEFSEIPEVINKIFYAIGRATSTMRRFTPMGTSLFAVLRRT